MKDNLEIRSLDHLLALLDGGNFLAEVIDGTADLQKALLDHRAEHGGKPKGEMVMKVKYELAKSGDVKINGEVEFKRPKAPAASGVAYVDDDGQLTLHSPFLARMKGGVRDTFDPDTGEVRDPNKPDKKTAE
jgi:hypothetical protein